MKDSGRSKMSALVYICDRCSFCKCLFHRKHSLVETGHAHQNIPRATFNLDRIKNIEAPDDHWKEQGGGLPEVRATGHIPNLAGQNLGNSSLGGNHDNGLNVASGEVGYPTSNLGNISTYKVVHSKDLGVSVDDGTNLGRTDEMVSLVGLLKKIIDGLVALQGVTSRLVSDGGDELLKESPGSLGIGLGGQIGSLLENSVSLLVKTQDTRRGRAVSKVNLDGDDTVTSSRGRALEVTSLAINSLARSEEDETVTTLGQNTRGLVLKELNVLGVGAVENTIGVEHAPLTISLDVDGKDGVVLDLLADGKVDPVSLGRESDTRLLGIEDLLLGPDTRVKQKSGSRHGTGRENDTAVLGEIDDLLLAFGGLYFNTSGARAGSDNADDLGTHLKAKVVALLREGESAVKTSVVALVVLGRHSGTGVASVQSLSSRGNITPLPSLGPLVVEVALGRVHENHVVYGNTTSKNTGSQTGSVGAHVLIPEIKATDSSGKTRDIDGSQGLVPWERVVGSSVDGRASLATLEKKNLLVSLRESLSSDDA
ncbi:hypothetical protein HG531_009315 [Fusarium graminearum]|nr:hypothetical protein HG531_009315 [Fusarium graminearum]